MDPLPPPNRRSPTAAEVAQHQLFRVLTQMRLHTQLLHRLAAQDADGPRSDRFVAGLAAIDAGITAIVHASETGSPDS